MEKSAEITRELYLEEKKKGEIAKKLFGIEFYRIFITMSEYQYVV